MGVAGNRTGPGKGSEVAVDTYIFDLDENVTRTPVSFKNRYGITSPRTSTGPRISTPPNGTPRSSSARRMAQNVA